MKAKAYVLCACMCPVGMCFRTNKLVALQYPLRPSGFKATEAFLDALGGGSGGGCSALAAFKKAQGLLYGTFSDTKLLHLKCSPAR